MKRSLPVRMSRSSRPLIDGYKIHPCWKWFNRVRSGFRTFSIHSQREILSAPFPSELIAVLKVIIFSPINSIQFQQILMMVYLIRLNKIFFTTIKTNFYHFFDLFFRPAGFAFLASSSARALSALSSTA